MKQPTVTVIIPTYQRAARLERAVRSALAQTYRKVRVCVYDNASGDETREVMARLSASDDRIRYYRHEVNIGPRANFNCGLRAVQSEYFSFLSDDDVLLPEFYEHAVATLNAEPDCMLCALEVAYLDARGALIGYSNPKIAPGIYRPPESLFVMFENGHPPTWTGVVFRAAVVQEVGELDVEVGPIDYDYVQRVAARFPIAVKSEVGALFVVHPESVGTHTKLDFVWPASLKMIENIANDNRVQKQIRDRARVVLTEDLKRKVYYFGRQAIKAGNWKMALEASEVLAVHFRSPMEAQSLRVVVQACRGSGLLHRLLVGIYKVRIYLSKQRRRSARPAESTYASEIVGVK